MKWLPLVWAALRRKPARSMFTLASIAIAFLLFGMMSGVSASFGRIAENIPANRIVVRARFDSRLPLAHGEHIARLDGVAQIAPMNLIFGYYRDQKNRISATMTDERLVDVVPEWKITAEQFAALKRVQAGAIVTRGLADRYRWTAGSNVPIESDIPRTDRTRTWTFTVVSIVPDVESVPHAPDGFFVGTFAFMNEGRADAENRGTANYFLVVVDDPAQAAAVSTTIENLFANSGVPLTATPERADFEAALEGFLDIEFFTLAVSAAALFMIALLTGNVMAQSVRERIPEFAVMKTIGFSDRAIVMLVLAEAVLFCFIGACIGLALAKAAPALGRLTFAGFNWLPIITPAVIGYAFAAALLVAVVSGLPAAWRVRRLSVVDALAGR